MSNEIVPYQQLERMSTAVAKSGLFGVKTPDQALALMLLAQSENIHPMTAVRDYHLINGRPSMKAEAMLARFQEAGGVVRWHALTDDKADASFSHPSSPEPVRICWDMKRAQTAGLAGKDIWKSYPRAMLRSRVVSEGIRTVLPGVLAGKYTPEETMHIESVEPLMSQEQRIDAIANTMLSEPKAEHIREIKASQEIGKLRQTFSAAWNAGKAMGDESAMEEFRLAYEERKAEIERPVIEGETTQEPI